MKDYSDNLFFRILHAILVLLFLPICLVVFGIYGTFYVLIKDDDDEQD